VNQGHITYLLTYLLRLTEPAQGAW